LAQRVFINHKTSSTFGDLNCGDCALTNNRARNEKKLTNLGRITFPQSRAVHIGRVA
jgi:hypothetical protein